MADSRPDPGPFMETSTCPMPKSVAFRATVSAATWAAYGVPLRDPLNPADPELAQHSVFPFMSVIVIRVLLNVDCINALPRATVRLSRLRGRERVSGIS